MSLETLGQNPLFHTDTYNLGHGSFKIDVGFEGSHMYNRAAGQILFGLSEIAKRCLNVILTHEHIDRAINRAKFMNLEFPEALFRRVVNELDGRIPLKVEMLPEGIWCPKGTPFAQIQNTVKGFGELVTWWEGRLMKGWWPTALATEAFYMRQYLLQTCKEHGFDWEKYKWRFHSFGYRGHNSEEAAYWAAIAWPLFLHGTDDFLAAEHAGSSAVIGSIPALAHKVTQQFDVEMDCCIRAIDVAAAKGWGIVAMPIDTWDANKFISRNMYYLLHRAKNAGVHVVLRPDSGLVVEQAIEIYKSVQEIGTGNCSTIIGESMSLRIARIRDIQLVEAGVPLDFVFYGHGSGYYKHLERDTNGWAMKTAYSNGADRMKLSMDEIKQSIPGLVDITFDHSKDNTNLIVIPRGSLHKYKGCELYQTVYEWNPSMHVPHIKTFDWNDTMALGRMQTGAQESIILSDEIKGLINNFIARYGGM